MILSHLVLGFVTSYIGYTPPSMLNITASKITIENNKKVARQFIWGASLVVLIQVFLAVLLSSFLEEYPELINWVKKTAVVVFAILSVVFIYKGLSKSKEVTSKTIQNGFLFGLSLSSINMFAIPFFAIAHSSFVMHGWAMSGLTCTSVFGIGTVLGTFAILSSYIYLAQKLQGKLLSYSKYLNVCIGIITGFVAIYSAVKLYF
ncbi:hypothetical protein WH52_13620 [Tenacibaculum holothuriorum]|uniref:Uncharacterized protein n=1 Tax=Tenacibaculum holothuriorum TaxID=1635173 RepID=A0A1Y2P9H3_9FLAO|nr:hypothetical protein [Tenacibaculum holothuriorum]OSY87095.1 hypothetical protein WH52_13620 [Tenacibaculum holothuriorum]